MPAPTVNTGQLATLFDISERHIQRLIVDGVLKRATDPDTGKELRGRFDLVHNVRAYCKYLREQARLDDASESMYVRLRNQKMAADAEQAGLRLAMFKGRLHRTEDVEFVITNVFTAVKAALLAIPSRTTRQLIGKSDYQTIFNIQMKEIELALDELIEVNAAMFNARNEQYLSALYPEPAGPIRSNGNGEDDDSQSANPDGD
jgi:phage terminase Nu1 subunit (DNA packaging protein)